MPQKTSQKIIDLIKEDPYISTTKMAEIIGVDRRNIARNIKKLKEQGAVRRVGLDKGGFWEVLCEGNKKTRRVGGLSSLLVPRAGT